MKFKFFPITLFIFFIIVFLIFYKGLKNSNIYIPNLGLQKDIPFFEATVFNSNKRVNSDEIFDHDQFYLMNIWASWCAPCREEHPFLMDLKKREKLKIIGLNYKDKKRSAKNFLLELKNPYDLIISDNDGTIAINWGAYGVPETFIIYNRKIIDKIIGPIDDNTILKINEILK
tara:strand:+ start:78 stop:596 length:519 start_codon:yes stop_codon:yes gene_type:complete